MNYQSTIETKQNGQIITEKSPIFNNPLQSEMWLENCVKQARELKIKITDHFLSKID
jgi:hypothetical protein